MEINFGKIAILKKTKKYSLVVSLFQRFLKKQFDQIGFESQVVHLAFRNIDPQVLFVSRSPKLQLRNEWLMVGITQTLNHEFPKQVLASPLRILCESSVSPRRVL